MKKLLIIIIFCLCLAGCDTAYRTTWYRIETSLDECYRDSCECLNYAKEKHLMPSQSRVYFQCMRSRGYRAVPEGGLPPGVKLKQADNIGSIYVAGW